MHGGRDLHGEVAVSGFKHSLVTAVAAAAAADSVVEVRNCPDIAETTVLSGLLTALGADVRRTPGALVVRAGGLVGERSPDLSAAGAIHGSVYLLPAVLARRGRVSLPVAGGCQIGDGPGGRRPVEQYISVLERFGATARASATALHVEAGSLRGCEIDLLDYTADRTLKSGPLYSGACKMALLTAAVAHGTSVLRNPYPKPDVTDLVDVLAALGADVEVDGDAVVVRGAGPDALRRDVTTTLVPDLIEVVTWITAGAVLAGSPLSVTAPGIDRAVRALAPEFAVLRAMGVRVDIGQDRLVAHPADRLRPAEVTVASHGVFSDSQPFLALLAAHAEGTSRITETVWTGRFGYQDGLAALGADLRHDGAGLVVRGPVPPRSPALAPLHAGDLRAAAVYLLAAVGVRGTTTITGVEHLARGYADLPSALRGLGADITTIERS